MARSGHKHKPGFEGGQMRLARRIPKRGFGRHVRGRVYVPVNVGALACFEDGADVTLAAMEAAGLAKGVGAGVKILGAGDLSRKLIVRAHAFSASARAKIEAAGGTCEIVARTTR
jgi:large subunit ribosomal protein L15